MVDVLAEFRCKQPRKITEILHYLDIIRMIMIFLHLRLIIRRQLRANRHATSNQPGPGCSKEV